MSRMSRLLRLRAAIIIFKMDACQRRWLKQLLDLQQANLATTAVTILVLKNLVLESLDLDLDF